MKNAKAYWCPYVTGITDIRIMLEIGSALSSLQSLDVSYCSKLTDKGLSAIAECCHGLRSLHVAAWLQICHRQWRRLAGAAVIMKLHYAN